MFGIPVSFSFSFFIFALIIAYPMLNRGDWASGFAVMAAFALTILVHEFGHAVMARFFGLTPAITLHAFGGMTEWERIPLSRGARTLISLAGPVVQILVGVGTTFVLPQLAVPPDGALHVLLSYFSWLSVIWGALNLIPMLPLDGGHLLLIGLDRAGLNHPALWTLRISIGLGAGLIVLAMVMRWPMAALLVAFLTYENVQTYRALNKALKVTET